VLIDLVDARLKHRGVSLITPREDRHRGGHVALSHPKAELLCRELHERQVIADYRKPDLLRLCPSPLYSSFEDCFEVIERLASIIEIDGRESRTNR
jgi:kynureninase